MNQDHGCWCPRDSRSQAISSQDIDLVLPEYSNLSSKKFKQMIISTHQLKHPQAFHQLALQILEAMSLIYNQDAPVDFGQQLHIRDDDFVGGDQSTEAVDILDTFTLHEQEYGLFYWAHPLWSALEVI